MRTWDRPQNFCSLFIDELEKQLFVEKKLLKWANKTCNKENTRDIIILHLCTKNIDDMIYRS